MSLTGNNSARILEWIEGVTQGAPSDSQVRYDVNVSPELAQIKILYGGVLHTFPSTEKVLEMIDAMGSAVYYVVSDASEFLSALAMPQVLHIYTTNKITLSSNDLTQVGVVSSKHIYAPADDYITFTGLDGTAVFEIGWPTSGANQDIDIQFHTQINSLSDLTIRATGNYFESGTYETSYTEHAYRYRLRLSGVNPQIGGNITVEGVLSDPTGGGPGFMFDKVEVANNFSVEDVEPGTVYGGLSGAIWHPWVNGSNAVKRYGVSSCAIQTRNIIAAGYHSSDGPLNLMEVVGDIANGTGGGLRTRLRFDYSKQPIMELASSTDGNQVKLAGYSNLSEWRLLEGLKSAHSHSVSAGAAPVNYHTLEDDRYFYYVENCNGKTVQYLEIDTTLGSEQAIHGIAHNARIRNGVWEWVSPGTGTIYAKREEFNSLDNLGGTTYYTSTGSSGEGSLAWKETHRIDKDGHVTYSSIPSGADQGAAGAVAGMLWKTSGHISLPDNVVMIGV